MRYFFASDLHGSGVWCERMLEKYRESGAERLILLGDLLYHGPRNELPEGYAPKRCIELLNAHRDDILCVRGNCEAEVDQMVLEFPVMADYALLVLNGLNFFATHGHHWNAEQLPPLKSGDILIHGHTHLLKAERLSSGDKQLFCLNPGSVALPKGGNPHSYGLLDGRRFVVYDFEGQACCALNLDSY